MENKIIALFEWIRDMPFEVRLGEKGYLADTVYILSTGRGSCSPKHYLLGGLYKRMGLNVAYLTYPFFWQDQEIDFPGPIKELSRKMPMCFHLNILANGSPFDATWDSPLARAGFVVNEISNMKNGILPCDKPIAHLDTRAREGFIYEGKKAESVCHEFYRRLNEWLTFLRQ